MKSRYIRDEKDWLDGGETVLVLGYFDGLHLGHKALLDRARQIADERGLSVTLLTFPESPQLAFSRFEPDLLLHLTSPEDRYQLMADYGVDELILLDFTSSFAATSPKEFVQDYIQKCRAAVLVAGFDYHFGNCRADVSDLADLFEGPVEVVEEVTLGGEKISSSRIRQAIKEGDLALANRLLGYPFSTRGLVVHGDARGRTIGYPTANLAPLDRVHLPAAGVYVAEVEVGGRRYRAMASVGKNVTFDGTEMRLEAHLFGFSRSIYGETIRIYWLDKIRDMVKFDGIESLLEQMKQDEKVALSWRPHD